MPNYDYRCRSCGKKFEIHHKMNEEPPKRGPQCEALDCNLEKQLSAPHTVIRSANSFRIPDVTGSAKTSATLDEVRKEDSSSHACTSGCSFHRH